MMDLIFAALVFVLVVLATEVEPYYDPTDVDHTALATYDYVPAWAADTMDEISLPHYRYCPLEECILSTQWSSTAKAMIITELLAAN